ncbi:MAG: MFS transporter [Firmicutes bacterium]|nr:MFS transporter [Bacillota bacterium]
MQSGISKKQKTFIFVACFYAFFMNGIVGVSLGSLLPMIKTTYNLDYKVSGMLLSAHSIGNLVAGYIAGLIPFYLGRKTSILFLSGSTVLGFLGMVLTGNPIFLFIAFLLTGIGRGSVSNFDNAIVNETSGGDPKALNLLHSFFAIGAFLVPFIILGFTKSHLPRWKYSVVLFSLMSLLVVVLFSFMSIENKKKDKGKAVEVSYAFLRDLHFWTSTGILFFYLCAEAAINGWLVTYFKDTGIISTNIAQMLSSLLWLVILIGRLTCAYLSKIISKRKILLLTSIGTVLFFISLLSTRNIVMIIISIIGLGFCMSGIYPTTVANLGDMIKTTPMAMGMLLSIAGLGAIAMPAITGRIAQMAGIFGGMAAITVAVILNFAFSVINYIRQK